MARTAVMPAIRLMVPVIPMAVSNKHAAIITGMSTLSVFVDEEHGVIAAVAPRISAMLAMFDPTMLPMLNPGLLAKAACRLTKSSGMDVPNPKIVMPITIGLSFARCAMLVAPSMSQSPPLTSITNPARINIMFRIIILVCKKCYNVGNMWCMVGSRWFQGLKNR